MVEGEGVDKRVSDVSQHFDFFRASLTGQKRVRRRLVGVQKGVSGGQKGVSGGVVRSVGGGCWMC